MLLGVYHKGGQHPLAICSIAVPVMLYNNLSIKSFILLVFIEQFLMITQF